MAINLTRITSRKKGAGKTQILTSAAVGHCAMAHKEVWLVAPTEHMVEHALHQMCSDWGIMPENLRVCDESTFAQMLSVRGGQFEGRDGRQRFRAIDHVFYDALDQKKRNTILDGLIALSELAEHPVYVTVAEN